MQSGHQLYALNTNAFNVYGINGADSDYAEVTPGCAVATSGQIQKKLNNFINQSCFAAPYPTVSADGGTDFGNSRPGILRGPAQNNTDLSLIKEFRVPWPNDEASVEFRAELFNAFNHPQFGDPGLMVDNPSTFGIINSTIVAPRITQFALKLSF